MPLYLVKYTSEIGTKSRGTRHKFVEKLRQNITEARCIHEGEGVRSHTTVAADRNHIQLITQSPASHWLACIPGVQYFVEAHKLDYTGLDDLAEASHTFFKPLVEQADTFAVRCRKTQQDVFSRKEVECAVGDKLVAYAKVNLTNPQVTCRIEIRGQQAYFYARKIPGMGGMPLGVQGKVLTLFSGGIDSPVAAWHCYRMGLDQDFLYFDLGGGANMETHIYRLAHHLKTKWGYGSKVRIIQVDFLPVIREIMKVRPSMQNLVLKYFFYKAADRLTGVYKARGIVTGESVGQVSTQTLTNLSTLDRLTREVVLRPLITATKEEIKAMAQRIGTLEMAYTGKEYCALATANVETAGFYAKLLNAVSHLDEAVLDKVLATRMEITLEDALQRIKQEDTPPPAELPKTSVIVDLRTETEQDNQPLPQARHIPFQQAWNDFLNWDRDKPYFLVCDIGSRSKLLARFMQEQGYDAEHLEGGLKRYYDQLKRLTASKA